jgi:hypothetical protein
VGWLQVAVENANLWLLSINHEMDTQRMRFGHQ